MPESETNKSNKEKCPQPKNLSTEFSEIFKEVLESKVFIKFLNNNKNNNNRKML